MKQFVTGIYVSQCVDNKQKTYDSLKTSSIVTTTRIRKPISIVSLHSFQTFEPVLTFSSLTIASLLIDSLNRRFSMDADHRISITIYGEREIRRFMSHPNILPLKELTSYWSPLFASPLIQMGWISQRFTISVRTFPNQLTLHLLLPKFIVCKNLSCFSGIGLFNLPGLSPISHLPSTLFFLLIFFPA